MTRLSWTNGNERLYETGLDRGVLYPKNGSAVVWNGLTSVEEKGSDSATAYYLDGRPYLYYTPPKEYEATLNAYTYPDEFSALMGLEEEEHVPGFYLDSQVAATFDLSYRTLIGSAAEGVDHGYKIHLVYNAIVAPQGNSYETLSDSINPSTFSWTINAVPEKISGYRPTAHIVINTKNMSEDDVALVEDILYGTDSEPASMPSASVVLDKLRYGDAIIITDNGDGTWSAEGGSYNIYQTSDTTFTVQNVDAVDNGDGTFGISSVTVPGNDSIETITKAEADRIEANVVVSGEVINGGLFLTTKGGTVINVGQAAQLPDGTDGSDPEVFLKLPSPDGQDRVTPVPEWATPFIGPSRLPVLSDNADNPNNTVIDAVWSPDSQYLAVGAASTNRLFVYKRVRDTFTSLTMPTYTTATANTVAWSPDGRYLATGIGASPYLLIFKREGDAFTLLPTSIGAPAGTVAGLSWSNDGRYLAVGTGATPYLSIYRFENDGLTLVATPVDIYAGYVYDVVWSLDDSVLFVPHAVSPYLSIYTFDNEVLTRAPAIATPPTSTAVLSLSPDGLRLLASYSSSGTNVYFFDGTTLTREQVIPYGPGAQWSPDGKYVAIAKTPEGLVFRYVNGNFYALPTPLATPVLTTINRVTWSPNGLYLALGGTSTTYQKTSVYKSSMVLPAGAPASILTLTQ